MSPKKTKQRYIVDAEILPEAILKTAQTKALLALEPQLSINQAVDQVGLSRSAFYKYRDGIFPYYEAGKEQIISLHIHMTHEHGVLGQVLQALAEAELNVLTIHQGLPIQGMARATLSMETLDSQGTSVEPIIESLYDIAGVIEVEMLGQTSGVVNYD